MNDYKIIIIFGFLLGYFILGPVLGYIVRYYNEDMYVYED